MGYVAMAKSGEDYRSLARRHAARAEGCSDQLRAVLLALGDTYDLLARVQDTLDDESAIYKSLHP
jgi:hypothetical protein